MADRETAKSGDCVTWTGRARSAAVCVLAVWLAACSGPASSDPPSWDVPADRGGAQAGDAGHAVAGIAPVVTGSIPAIVVLEPRHDIPLPEPAYVPYMDQASRIFIPSLLFVRTGHPAEFRNSDEELHNINVWDLETRQQIFNVAVPIEGTYVHTFDESGVYDVSCDVHPGMSAQIVATSTPYVALADAAGRFEFTEVVAGAYELVIYAGAETLRKTIEVREARTDVGTL